MRRLSAEEMARRKTQQRTGSLPVVDAPPTAPVESMPATATRSAVPVGSPNRYNSRVLFDHPRYAGPRHSANNLVPAHDLQPNGCLLKVKIMIGMSLELFPASLDIASLRYTGTKKEAVSSHFLMAHTILAMLLTACLVVDPSAKHRSALDANKRTKCAVGQAANRRTSRRGRCGGATMALLNSKETQAAVRLLATLPGRMLEVSQKIDPVPYPQNTLAGFKLSVVEWLANNIKAARDE